MDETFVRLVCPDCQTAWKRPPGTLPTHDQTFACHDCEAERRLAEFTRTDHDLAVLKQFQG
jgi:hypothetical protein